MIYLDFCDTVYQNFNLNICSTSHSPEMRLTLSHHGTCLNNMRVWNFCLNNMKMWDLFINYKAKPSITTESVHFHYAFTCYFPAEAGRLKKNLSLQVLSYTSADRSERNISKVISVFHERSDMKTNHIIYWDNNKSRLFVPTNLMSNRSQRCWALSTGGCSLCQTQILGHQCCSKPSLGINKKKQWC